MYRALLSPRWAGIAERDIARRAIFLTAQLMTDDADALHTVRARQLLRIADASHSLPPSLPPPRFAFKADPY